MQTPALSKPIPGRLFAHLGAHKTASTMMQRTFLEHRDTFLESGIYYIPYQDFRRQITNKTPQWRRQSPDGNAEMQAAVSDLLPEGGIKALLVSDEALAGHIRSDLQNRPHRIYEHCHEVVSLLKHTLGKKQMVIFFMIRSYGEFLESCYLQLVRAGYSQSFETYIQGFDLAKISWVPTIQELAQHLTGDEDLLVVYDYALLNQAPGEVLSDLFDRMGVPPPQALQENGRERINTSYSEPQFRKVLLLNRYWKPGIFKSLRKWVLKAINHQAFRSDYKCRFLSNEYRERLAARYSEDLEIIRQMNSPVKLYQPITRRS